VAELVIDTNCVLDLWVFDDPGTRPLRAALEHGGLRWLATGAMRDELARVLDYPRIAPRLARAGMASAQVLAAFDAHAELMPPAAPSAVRCRDPDDQPFIDLAAAWRATLLSKDASILRLARRLAPLGVDVRRP
jgi:putative PIN family toxin of toxin-antitoxin system